MKRTKAKRQCSNCYFTRKIASVLHCIKDPPALDPDTGAAKWPTVEQEDVCGCFCDLYDDVSLARSLRDPRIHTDKFGKYCKIPLTKGQFAKVDPEDFLWLSQYNWYCHIRPHTSYAARNKRLNKKQKRFWMHREIIKTPEHLVCDHINRNGLDNRRSNMRIVTHSQNHFNEKLRTDNTSGYKGVYYHKSSGGWVATLGKKHLGCFRKKSDAIKCRKNNFANIK